MSPCPQHPGPAQFAAAAAGLRMGLVGELRIAAELEPQYLRLHCDVDCTPWCAADT